MTTIEEAEKVNIYPTRVTENIRHGSSFELNPTENEFEIAFIDELASAANQHKVGVNIIDLGFGNGDLSFGLLSLLLSKIKKGTPITYGGLDLDPSNVLQTEQKIAQLRDISTTEIIQADLHDLENVTKFIKSIVDMHNVNSIFLCEVLHWLDLQDIKSILHMLYDKSPVGTQVLATACSVWNRTSIGDPDTDIQKTSIERVRQHLIAYADQPIEGKWLTRPDTSMTFFSVESFGRLFKDVGWDVQSNQLVPNYIYPNNIAGLNENVDLVAVKR